MEEPVDMRPLVRLVKRVTRAFFQTPFIVVMDELTKHEAISDEELSKTIGLTVKEIHKICGTLKENRLLKTFQRMEPKKADQRPVPKTYYYIDWQQFVNVVKWKIYKIRVMVGDRMRNELENKGYICPNCKKTYSPLDVAFLLDHERGVFTCEVCSTELKHNDNAENVKGSEQLHGRFMEQSQPMIDLLKDIDKLRIPATTIDKIAGSSSGKGSLQTSQDKEISYAQESGNLTGGIVVVFQDDNEASKRAKEAEIEKKRQQNALPVWHARSTISGETMVADSLQPTISNKQKEDQHEIKVEQSSERDKERKDYYASYYANYQQQAASTPADDDEFDTVTVDQTDQFMNENEDDEFMDGAEEDEFMAVEVNGIRSEDSDEFEAVELDEGDRGSKRSRTGSMDEEYPGHLTSFYT
ncbi:3811_t:CDS:10 [Paraglomus brasilianum]|uniref:3811_t:CDS:1 n=1 Tax=Paraglomus brasilianum TaxID=144538 RepID=A0A9N8WS68_9GLOM|nr:3811_t:CDS:10 [Paraglomus brasilianum]